MMMSRPVDLSSKLFSDLGTAKWAVPSLSIAGTGIDGFNGKCQNIAHDLKLTFFLSINSTVVENYVLL